MTARLNAPRTETTNREERSATTRILHARPVQGIARRMNGAIIFTVAIALIASVGMLYLLQTNHVANLGYQMSELQAERAERTTANQHLTAQIAELQALDQVESVAVKQIGMEPMEKYIFLTLNRPAQDELTLPEPVDDESGSILDRIWGAFTGEGEAVNASEVEQGQ